MQLSISPSSVIRPASEKLLVKSTTTLDARGRALPPSQFLYPCF